MKLETTQWHAASGWSSELPATLDSQKTLVLAFGASACLGRSAPLEELRSAFPRASMLGCSSAGEIFDNRVYDETISLAVARFEDVRLRTVSSAIGPGTASFAAGEELARGVAEPDLRAVLVLSEGIEVNGSELVRGIASIISPSVPVIGGLAADGERFQQTWVFDGQMPVRRRVVALGLYGPRVAVTHGSKGGWDIFGVERVVTRSMGNVVYEIDHKPALALYKEYLGDRAEGLPATALLFPLAMRASRVDDRQLVRTVLAVSEREQSLTFAGDIPSGSLVQLMYANFDRLVQGASDAATLADVPEHRGRALLSIAVSCVGRRIVLGERTEDELDAALQRLPAQTRQIGFYSYGEISPFVSGACDLHNQTMTLSTISELE